MQKFFLTTIIIFNFLFTISLADQIKKITVKGNERISKDTIILFSELKANDEITYQLLNKAIKKLYETNYFDLIDIDFKNDEVIINVVENKIIQSIEVKGVKNKGLNSDIGEIVKKDEKTSYLKDKVKRTSNEILNLLRSVGYYFSEVTPLITENENNSVDIVFDIITGDRAIIEKINFVGDKKIKDKKLRNVILSEEGKFWKFLTRNKYLDIQ